MSKQSALKRISEEVLLLEKSPLYSYRNANNYFPVSGEGSEDAHIMLVGEAPGRNEAKTGKPFCGAAGKVLDALLEHIGIKRESVYITNIVKDRPPENRDPTSKEIEVYGPFLDRQIEIIQPRAIVALGRYAMSYIMRKFDLDSKLEPIGHAHGKAYKTKVQWQNRSDMSDNDGKNVKPANMDVVVLYHPCVAVYNPNNLPKLKKDFEILKKYA